METAHGDAQAGDGLLVAFETTTGVVLVGGKVERSRRIDESRPIDPAALSTDVAGLFGVVDHDRVQSLENRSGVKKKVGSRDATSCGGRFYFGELDD